MAINLDLMPVQNKTAKDGLAGIEQAIYQVAKVLGGDTKFDWKSIKAIVNAGRAAEFFNLGDEISVKNAYDVIVSASSGSATIDGHKFIVAMNETRSKPYIFNYTGSEWQDENKNPVDLTEIGITFSGTPTSETQIEVIEQCFDVEFLVGRANSQRLTLIPAKAQFLNELMFDNKEYMFAKASIIAAGTYYFKVGSNYYSFTISNNVPVGGGITINSSTSPASASVFNNPTSTSASETLTITNNGATEPSGTYIGVVNSNNDSLGIGANDFLINAYNRQEYGNNNYVYSNIRQFINSDNAKGQWYVQSHPLDRCSWVNNYNGFLWGLDPSFVEVLGAKERTCIGANCENNEAYTYADKMYYLTNKEIMFTTYADEEEHLPYFEMFTTTPSDNSSILNNERRRTNFLGSSFVAYYLASAYRSNSYHVCNVVGSGIFSHSNAPSSTAVCLACDILAE